MLFSIGGHEIHLTAAGWEHYKGISLGHGISTSQDAKVNFVSTGRLGPLRLAKLLSLHNFVVAWCFGNSTQYTFLAIANYRKYFSNLNGIDLVATAPLRFMLAEL